MGYLPTRRNLSELVAHWEDRDGDFCQRYPAIYNLLSAAQQDGKYRPGARLTLFCDTDRLKCSIWDEATQQSWYCTLKPEEDVLAEVESLLAAGKGEWRAKRNGR